MLLVLFFSGLGNLKNLKPLGNLKNLGQFGKGENSGLQGVIERLKLLVTHDGALKR
jgi:hypothetical protein